MVFGKNFKDNLIRIIYLYLTAFIGVIIVVIGTITIIGNVLTNFVFQMEYLPYGSNIKCEEPRFRIGAEKAVAPTEEEIQKCEAREEKNEEIRRINRMKNNFAWAIAQILVGFPLWYFHWAIIRKDSQC